MRCWWALLLGSVALGTSAQTVHEPEITSQIDGDRVVASLDAILDHPLHDVESALADPPRWCAALILHLNNKGCTVREDSGQPHIGLAVARRYDQPVEEASLLDFGYQVVHSTSSGFSVRLNAADGPFGTSDYSIQIEARASGGAHTAVKLSYGYRQGALTGTAMDLYFATVGRGKVGFTVAASGPDGTEYVGGTRGLLERNLVRYLFAIDAAASTPVVRTEADYERRLHAWFRATERHPRQLHEIDLQTYLALKRPLLEIGMPASDRPRR
jgi:hypothetical protein